MHECANTNHRNHGKSALKVSLSAKDTKLHCDGKIIKTIKKDPCIHLTQRQVGRPRNLVCCVPGLFEGQPNVEQLHAPIQPTGFSMADCHTLENQQLVPREYTNPPLSNQGFRNSEDLCSQRLRDVAIKSFADEIIWFFNRYSLNK